MKNCLTFILLSCLPFLTLAKDAATDTKPTQKIQKAPYIGIDKVIAIVDDSIITLTDIEAAKKRLSKNMTAQGKAVPGNEKLTKMAVNSLILENIQLQMAQRAGVSITEDYLLDAISQLARREGLTLEAFVEKLKDEGESYEELREQIKNELSIQQVQQSYLRNRININEQAIQDYLNSAEGKARIQSKYVISHIFIRSQDPKAAEVLKKVAADIKAGKRRYSDFNTPKTIDGFEVENGDLGERTQAELPTLFADIIPTMQPGDLSEPVQSGAGWHIVQLEKLSGAAKIIHQINARHILIKLSEVRNDKQAKQLIDDLYKRLKKGEDFSLLAKEYSEDTGSALQGGELDWAEPSKYVGAFKDTLLKLKNQETSKPFKTEFGWHIVQKLGERDHNVTEELRKNQAFQTLYQRKAAEEIDSWLNQIRNEAFIDFKDPSFDPDFTPQQDKDKP